MKCLVHFTKMRNDARSNFSIQEKIEFDDPEGRSSKVKSDGHRRLF